jgi:mono/diheme cytochrome c family protein
MNSHLISARPLVTISLLIIAVSACGPASPTQVLPTPTPFPTFQYVPRTEAPSVLTIGAATNAAGGTAVLNPENVEAGKASYVRLQCGSCHGDDGKGTTQGPALAGTKLSETDFIGMLRTGGKLGNAHLFSTNRLSDAGGKNLYLYIRSLSSGS